jgi:hypothetical protein
VTTGSTVIRIILGAIGALMILGGLLLVLYVGPVGGLTGGAWLLIGGAVLLIGVLIEASRYRSQAAEHAKLSPGPGGGETGPLEPRFMATPEVFVDPTSNRRMRVYVDTRTGERRYVAEG